MEPHSNNALRNVYKIWCDSPVDLVLTCLACHDMFVCFVLNSAFSLFGVALADIRYVATIKDCSTSFDQLSDPSRN